MNTLARLFGAKPSLEPYPRWNLNQSQAKTGILFRLREWIWRSTEAPFTLSWLEGIQIWCSSRDETLRGVFITGQFEPNEFFLLDKILRPGMSFIDVGANLGLYTLFAAKKVGPEGVVLALEPSSREFQKLRANVELNNLCNVRLLQMGASARAGEAELLIAVEEWAGHNTLGTFVYDVALHRKEMVQLGRLDDIVRQEGLLRVDVVKVDIEGAEWFALQGAIETLRQFRPILLLEVSDRMLKRQGCNSEQIWGFLADLGYRLYAFNEQTGLPVPAIQKPSFDGENLVAFHPMRAELWPLEVVSEGESQAAPNQPGTHDAETAKLEHISR